MSALAAKLASKSAWPLAERGLRMAVGMGVTALVARHLGPGDFGAVAFAMAWTTFLGGFSWLGLGDTVVRDLVHRPHDRDRLLGTVAVLRGLGSLVSVALAVGLFPVFYAEQPRSVAVLVWWFAWAAPFSEAAGVPVLWNQSQGDMRTTVLTRLIPHLVAQTLRAACAAGGAALVWFGVLGPVETVLAALASWGTYLYRLTPGARPHFDRHLVRPLLHDALPILGTAVLATLTMRLDQMMLAKFSTLDEVGYYAAATRFSEIWWSVPGILMQVAGPLVLFGEHDAQRRNHRLAGLYAVLIAAACLAAGLTIAVAPLAVHWLFGARFASAVPVLTIHVLTAVVVFADAPSIQELIRRGEQRILLWKGVVTLATNAALNFWLIPRYGAIGASIATVASYLAAVVFAPLAFAQVRDLARMQLGAPLWLLRYGLRRRRLALGRSV